MKVLMLIKIYFQICFTVLSMAGSVNHVNCHTVFKGEKKSGKAFKNLLEKKKQEVGKNTQIDNSNISDN